MKHLLRFGYSQHILLAVTIIFLSNFAAAQNGIPGRWKRVLTYSYAYDINFHDSLNGVSFGSNFLISSDGGATWNADSTRFNSLTINSLNAVECTGPSRAIVMKSNCTQLELVRDSIFQADCPQDSPDSFFQEYTPIAEKMYDSLYGFRFVQVVTRGSLYDMAYLAVTHDAWKTYSAYGDSLIGKELLDPNYKATIVGATIVDSNEVWVGVANVIYRTTNAGASWDTIVPMKGTLDSNLLPRWYDINIDKTTKKVYAAAIPGVYPIDFAYSPDYGKTWQIDSTFGGHVARLAVPAKDTLWAVLIPHSVTSDATPPQYYLFTPQTFGWCTKLAYSSDNGHSWAIDSTTFIVDSMILQMKWLDGRHGWISSLNYSDTETFSTWYYDADANASVPTVVGVKFATIRVYPNPASTMLYVDPVDPNVVLYDPLGRSYHLPLNGNMIDISSLPSGVYYIYDGIAVRAKFMKE